MTGRITKIILRGDISGLKASMTAGGTAVNDLTKRITASTKEAATWRQGMTAVGDSALKMGLVASAGLLLAGKAAMDWESAWAGVTKTVNGSASQMAELEGGLRNLAKSLPATHSEIAAVAEAAGQLGVAREDILGFTKTMIDLGETTNLTADEAATSIAQLQNIMGDSPDDVDNLGAALVALGNDGASTERDIVQMAQRIAGAGKTVGLATSDVLAISNAVASMGIDVEAGGTAVSTVLSRMAMATSTGGDKLDAFASVARVSADEFATAFKERPAEALVMFTKGLEQTQKAGGDLYGQLKEVGLSDVRVSQALIGMASSGDLLTDSLTLGAEAWKANTALSAEAEKRYGTTAAQVKVAWNEMKDAAIDAGAALLPVAKTMASAVSSVSNAFGGLSSPVQSGLTAVGGIAAVSLLVVGATAKMIQSVAATRLAITQLGLTASSTGAFLGILAKSGAGLAAFWAGAAIGDKIGERTSSDIDKMSASLERLGKTGKATGDLENWFGEDLGGKGLRFGRDLDSIGDALKNLEKYGDDTSLTEAFKFFRSAGQEGGITEQVEALGDLDKAFSVLARNKPDAAIAAFEKLRDRALETGASTKDIERAFPAMTELLRGASESMGGTSDASEILKGNLSDLAPAAQLSAEEIKAAQEALDAARESAMATSLSFFDFSRDAKQSFGDYLDQLEKSADAYANFTENAIQASANGLDGGLIDQLREQGPEGALALADFADASEKEIARANRAFRDTTGLSALQAELDLLPDDIVTNFQTAGAPNAIETAAQVAAEYKMSPELVETILKAKDYTKADIKAVLARLAELDATTANPKVNVDTEGGAEKLRALQNLINGMNGKTVRVAVEGGTGGGITKNATGGAIRGPGTGTSDSILSLVSNGEHVLTADEVNKAGGQGEIYRLRAAIRAGTLPKFATGGAVSKLDIKNQERTIRDLERSFREREEYGKKPKKGKRKTRLVLKPGSLDWQIAKMELAEAKLELKDLKSGGEARREAAEKAAKAKQDRIDTAMGTRDSVASGLAGGFALSDQIKKNPLGIYRPISGASIAAGASAYAAKLKAFAGKIEQARRLGIPTAMLQEVAGLGVEEGTVALDALLASSSSEIAQIQTAYRDIDTYAKGAGEVIAKALDLSTAGQDSAAGYAEGFINGLNGYAAQMQAAATAAAQGQTTKAKAKKKSQTAYGEWQATPVPAGTFTTSNPWASAAAAPAAASVATPLVLDGAVVGVLHQVAGKAARIEVKKAASSGSIEARMAR